MKASELHINISELGLRKTKRLSKAKLPGHAAPQALSGRWKSRLRTRTREVDVSASNLVSMELDAAEVLAGLFSMRSLASGLDVKAGLGRTSCSIGTGSDDAHPSHELENCVNVQEKYPRCPSSMTNDQREYHKLNCLTMEEKHPEESGCMSNNHKRNPSVLQEKSPKVSSCMLISIIEAHPDGNKECSEAKRCVQVKMAKCAKDCESKSKSCLTEVEKQAHRLRRIHANRDAARRTFQKKQMLCKELMKRADSLIAQNEDIKQKKQLLIGKLHHLREQNYHLKQQLAIGSGTFEHQTLETASQPLDSPSTLARDAGSTSSSNELSLLSSALKALPALQESFSLAGIISRDSPALQSCVFPSSPSVAGFSQPVALSELSSDGTTVPASKQPMKLSSGLPSLQLFDLPTYLAVDALQSSTLKQAHYNSRINSVCCTREGKLPTCQENSGTNDENANRASILKQTHRFAQIPIEMEAINSMGEPKIGSTAQSDLEEAYLFGEPKKIAGALAATAARWRRRELRRIKKMQLGTIDPSFNSKLRFRGAASEARRIRKDTIRGKRMSSKAF